MCCGAQEDLVRLFKGVTMTFDESVNNRLGQLELNIRRVPESDRNFHKGGRSFYFFDFDDNVVTLKTPIVLFKKKDVKSSQPDEVFVSSTLFARHSTHIGKNGLYRDYELRFEDTTGSFRYFRDQEISDLERAAGKKQGFLEDFSEVFNLPDHIWKGPSWSCFYHAVFNRRPISLITARGHHPKTMREGIEMLIKTGFLPHSPNYLSLYPVNHPATRLELGHDLEDPVPLLKRSAIRASVEKAIAVYGFNPHHRFGMSDDDPKNIELIVEEMVELKKDFPDFSFFVIDTHEGRFVKKEIHSDHIENFACRSIHQLSLF